MEILLRTLWCKNDGLVQPLKIRCTLKAETPGTLTLFIGERPLKLYGMDWLQILSQAEDLFHALMHAEISRGEIFWDRALESPYVIQDKGRPVCPEPPQALT